MPYRVDGSNVMHEKDGKWTVKQKCKDHAAAIRALRLLNAIEHNPEFKPRNK